MNRYRITVEYDGRPYAGWQRQSNAVSVQGEIETALKKLTGETATIGGAGRTDAGVHASGQIAHFDLEREWRAGTIRDGLNAHLREQPIIILEAEQVDRTFDSRFSATARHYSYRVLNRRSPPAIDRWRVWHVPRPVDIEAMRAGAKALIGRHDFTTFRSSDCQAKSPVKNLDRLDITQNGEDIAFVVSARSFLHSQVRSMVGTLVKVGTGAWPVSRVGEVLAARDRTACGPLAPPFGLYLVRVDYDPK